MSTEKEYGVKFVVYATKESNETGPFKSEVDAHKSITGYTEYSPLSEETKDKNYYKWFGDQGVVKQIAWIFEVGSADTITV